MQKKNYPLRINEGLLNKIKEISVKEDRSINYTINKLLEQSLNEDNINVKDFIMEDIKAYSKKANITVSEAIEQMWKIFSKTYKR